MSPGPHRPLKIGFVNPNRSHDYDADTPWQRPLAGSVSAQVFLAIALAERGHEVHMVTGTWTPGKKRGVICRSLDKDIRDFAGFDVVLVTNQAPWAATVRKGIGDEPVVLAWEHNLWVADPGYAGALRSMTGPRDGVLCVSEWHRRHFVEAGGLDPAKVFVSGNAVSPFFEGMVDPAGPILANKPRPPRMAFTSAPNKGMEAAVLAFEALYPSRAQVRLHLYSDFSHYPPNARFHDDPKWQALFGRCRATPGIEWHGSVPQRDLAAALREVSVLFFPNTWEETSSISTMEAMAAGCAVVVPAVGALPETTAGFAETVAVEEGRLDLAAFVDRARDLVDRIEAGDPALEERLRAQVAFVAREYTWARRAEVFEGMVGAWVDA